MERIRQIVKEVLNDFQDKILFEIEERILNEAFDELKLPENLEIEKRGEIILYKFISNTIQYGVTFTPLKEIGNIMIPDFKLKAIVDETSSKYTSNFGPLGQNGLIDTEIITKFFNQYEVLSFVFGIVKKFINENNPQVISYIAKGKRKSIYNYIFNKFFKQEFIYYTAKPSEEYNVFFINRKLIKDL